MALPFSSSLSHLICTMRNHTGIYRTLEMLAAQGLWEYIFCPKRWVLIPQPISFHGCLSICYWKKGIGMQIVSTKVGATGYDGSQKCWAPPAPRPAKARRGAQGACCWTECVMGRVSDNIGDTASLLSWRCLENFSTALEDRGIKNTWFFMFSVAPALQGTSTKKW